MQSSGCREEAIRARGPRGQVDRISVGLWLAGQGLASELLATSLLWLAVCDLRVVMKVELPEAWGGGSVCMHGVGRRQQESENYAPLLDILPIVNAYFRPKAPSPQHLSEPQSQHYVVKGCRWGEGGRQRSRLEVSGLLASLLG